MNPTALEMLRLLMNGHWHAEHAISSTCRISSGEFTQTLADLRMMGIALQYSYKLGVRLSPDIELLSHSAILDKLPETVREKPIDLTIDGCVTSTNEVLLNRSNPTSGMVSLAEMQTQGRGRFGRQWLSPFATSIYGSLFWKFQGDYSKVAGLSLVVGISIADVLNIHTSNKVKIKWPNDLIVDGKKLAGILIETRQDVDGLATVIGFGINVHASKVLKHSSWTHLNASTRVSVSRNDLVAQILESLFNNLKHFEHVGFGGFQSQWVNYDALAAQSVALAVAGQTHIGCVAGVDNSGCLVINQSGNLRAFSSGEATVLKDVT